MISYRSVPISSQKEVLFLRHPVDVFSELQIMYILLTSIE